MKKYKQTKISVNEIESIVCDICGMIATTKDFTEFQEMIQIKHSCGYGSIFGDESDIECDICQTCLKKLLGKHLKVGP
jgi:hypothetical protein